MCIITYKIKGKGRKRKKKYNPALSKLWEHIIQFVATEEVTNYSKKPKYKSTVNTKRAGKSVAKRISHF